MITSEDVREELAAIAPQRECDRLAELSALFHTAGSLHLRGAGDWALHLDLGSAAAARRAFALLRALRRPLGDPDLPPPRVRPRDALPAPRRRRRRARCTCWQRPACVDRRHAPLERPPRRVVARCCCRAAYLRGAFLGAGSVSTRPLAAPRAAHAPRAERRRCSRASLHAEGVELAIVDRADSRGRVREELGDDRVAARARGRDRDGARARGARGRRRDARAGEPARERRPREPRPHEPRRAGASSSVALDAGARRCRPAAEPRLRLAPLALRRGRREPPALRRHRDRELAAASSRAQRAEPAASILDGGSRSSGGDPDPVRRRSERAAEGSRPRSSPPARCRGSTSSARRDGVVDSRRHRREARTWAIRVGINGFGRIGRNFFRAQHAARRRHRDRRAQRPRRRRRRWRTCCRYDSVLGPLAGRRRARRRRASSRPARR